MSKTIIVTDSNSGILQGEAKELGIYVIPMPFTINDEEYLEEISISQEKFYEFLAADADVTTSQPSQFYLEELWTKLLKKYDEIVYIPMTSGLSATCENAKRYAENFNGKVHVVDNKRISVTQKASVFEAIYLLKDGKSAKEIKEYLERRHGQHSIYIMVSTLKYLKKGGRISAAAAAVGSMLKLKPILSSRGEKFERFAMTMTVSQARKKMIQQIKLEIESEFKTELEAGKIVLAIAHTQNEAEALAFKEEVEKEFAGLEIRYVDPLSLSVSCHIGPGSLALTFFVDNFNAKG